MPYNLKKKQQYLSSMSSRKKIFNESFKHKNVSFPPVDLVWFGYMTYQPL